MFNCNNCHKISLPRQSCYKLVVEKRPKIYKIVTKCEKDGHEIERVKESRGSEIVKELKLCGDCYLKMRPNYV